MTGSPGNANGGHNSEENDTVPDNSSVPKPKRLACMICRKRKLKCDGLRPSCSTCSRLGHSCAYDEQRRKSGPKRGYVKALEERLKQVETLLKTQDPPPANGSSKNTNVPSASSMVNNPSMMNGDHDMDRWNYSAESPCQAPVDDFNSFNNMGMQMNGGGGGGGGSGGGGGHFTWEMIGLGLEEPLPPQETIDELHQVYFEKVHLSMPMIHKYRYLAAMNLAPNQRPPVCLRYAMWTMACSITDKYADLKDLFYQRARKYVESDYVKGYGEHMISIAHCQAHILLACYEIKAMYFPRAWINTGSAVRLAQMIGLHRLDGAGLDVKQCLPPPKDWTEREERRRTFWMAFCEDRYTSIGTGWPMTIDERDITTKLPSSEEAFEMSRPEQTQTLGECTSPAGAAKMSAFGGVVLLACLFGRNLVHLHRPDDDDQDHDVNGPFWKRHRQMDNILLNTSLCLPSHLKLPAGLSNPNVVFTNMSIHTSTICLHQAAIFKAEKNKLPASVSSESKVRCITAANEIASIMRTISHMDLSAMNPFISFCLYVSARVFVQYLKSKPDDDQTADSLRFLLSAMNALKRRNQLTESFLVQLDVDFEALAARIPKLKNAFPRPGDPASNPHGAKSPGPVCDNPESIAGIMSYRDTPYAKPGEKAPDQTEGSGALPQSAAFGAQPWLSAEHQMPVLTPNSSTMYEKANPTGRAFEIAGDSQDGSGSPEGQSNGPTPNSSNSSDRLHLTPGQMNASSGAGVSSVPRQEFRASPMSPSQNMLNGGGSVPAEQGGHQNFFAANGYPMPAGITNQPGFAMGTGWGDMNSQQSEGVLRVLMNMGPMEAMDLSSWDSGNEPMRG